MNNDNIDIIIQQTPLNISNFMHGIFIINSDGQPQSLNENTEDILQNKQDKYLNTYLDLSNLIFDIKDKINDNEYKNIMDTLLKLKENS